MDSYFPFDGTAREWEYVNEDPAITHTLLAVLDVDFELASDNSTRIYNISTEQVCPGSDAACEAKWLNTIRMSSSPSAGAQLHGYSTEAHPDVNFEKPISFTDGKMMVGESIETSDVDGHDWVATFEATEPCNIQWNDAWDNCVRIQLESSPEGHWMAGTYWAITSYNIVAKQLTGDSGRWELFDAHWESE